MYLVCAPHISKEKAASLWN